MSRTDKSLDNRPEYTAELDNIFVTKLEAAAKPFDSKIPTIASLLRALIRPGNNGLLCRNNFYRGVSNSETGTIDTGMVYEIIEMLSDRNGQLVNSYRAQLTEALKKVVSETFDDYEKKESEIVQGLELQVAPV